MASPAPSKLASRAIVSKVFHHPKTEAVGRKAQLYCHWHPGFGHPCKLNFEDFVANIIFDGNSQVRFHNPLVIQALD
jgi:hypothetical protein